MSNLPHNFHQPAPGPSPGGRESCRAAAGWWPIFIALPLLSLACGCEIAAGYEERESSGTNGTEKTEYRFKGEGTI